MINIENLSKSFGKEQVLKNINLTINPNEVTAIIGPSGSGKSTLLRCLNNLEKIDNGTISFFNEYLVNQGKYSSQETQRLIEKKMTMIFQRFHLFPHFSVLDNLVVAQKVVLKRNKNEAKEVADKLLKQFDLSSFKNKYPSQLSGGQQQRVAIARGMAINPTVMLLDEPTSALDPELVSEVQDSIRTLKSEGIGIILVTHEMSFVEAIADRVIFMLDGEVVEDGESTKVFNETKHERLKNFLNRN